MNQAALFDPDPELEGPALRYYGGKWRLARQIARTFTPHRTYLELFMGGANVLLRKRRSQIEVANDISGSVVNFFRVLRDRSGELERSLSLTPFALEEYEAANAVKWRHEDPVEAARVFFVASWGGHTGTNGDWRARGWRRTADRDVAGDMRRAVKRIQRLAERLRGVAIDHLPWEDCLAAYDRPDTFIYADPPYVRTARAKPEPSNGYGANDFDDGAHERLLAALEAAKGGVALSGYASPLYERLLDKRRWSSVILGKAKKEVLWIKQPRSR